MSCAFVAAPSHGASVDGLSKPHKMRQLQRGRGPCLVSLSVILDIRNRGSRVLSCLCSRAISWRYLPHSHPKCSAAARSQRTSPTILIPNPSITYNSQYLPHPGRKQTKLQIMSLSINVKLSQTTSPAKTKICLRASAPPRLRASINLSKPISLSQVCRVVITRSGSLLSISVPAFRLNKTRSLQIRIDGQRPSTVASDKRRTTHDAI